MHEPSYNFFNGLRATSLLIRGHTFQTSTNFRDPPPSYHICKNEPLIRCLKAIETANAWQISIVSTLLVCGCHECMVPNCGTSYYVFQVIILLLLLLLPLIMSCFDGMLWLVFHWFYLSVGHGYERYASFFQEYLKNSVMTC